MRLPIIIFLVASVALSGCFGVPEGAAEAGDAVYVHGIIRDADGSPIGGFPNTTATAGGSFPVMGVSFDGTLVGATEGDSFAGAWSGEATATDLRLPASFGPFDLDPALSRSAVEGAVGPVSVGDSLPNAILGLYAATITAVNETAVMVSIEVEDMEPQAFPDIGGTLVPRAAENRTFFMDLDPDVGAGFYVSSPFSNTLQLPAGGYFVLGQQGDEVILLQRTDVGAAEASNVVYLMSGSGTFEVDMTVRGVQETQQPLSENYGQRVSPVLRRDTDDTHDESVPHTHEPVQEPADGHDHTH